MRGTRKFAAPVRENIRVGAGKEMQPSSSFQNYQHFGSPDTLQQNVSRQASDVFEDLFSEVAGASKQVIKREDPSLLPEHCPVLNQPVLNQASCAAKELGGTEAQKEVRALQPMRAFGPDDEKEFLDLKSASAEDVGNRFGLDDGDINAASEQNQHLDEFLNAIEVNEQGVQMAEENGLNEQLPAREIPDSESSGDELLIADEDHAQMAAALQAEHERTPCNSDCEDDTNRDMKKVRRPMMKRLSKRKNLSAYRSLTKTFEQMDGPAQTKKELTASHPFLSSDTSKENFDPAPPTSAPQPASQQSARRGLSDITNTVQAFQRSDLGNENLKVPTPADYITKCGTWVQCCSTKCNKWRFLANVDDPATIPVYWECKMNPDAVYNACDIPEAAWTREDEISSVYTSFVPGSLVWAKMVGFPWWPGMVQVEQEADSFFRLNGFSEVPTHYHVMFFDSESPSRSWISSQKLKPYSSHNPGGHVGLQYRHRIEIACSQAAAAQAMDMSDRLSFHSFSPKKNKIDISGPSSPSQDVKKRLKRKPVSEKQPVAFDLYQPSGSKTVAPHNVRVPGEVVINGQGKDVNSPPPSGAFFDPAKLIDTVAQTKAGLSRARKMNTQGVYDLEKKEHSQKGNNESTEKLVEEAIEVLARMEKRDAEKRARAAGRVQKKTEVAVKKIVERIEQEGNVVTVNQHELAERQVEALMSPPLKNSASAMTEKKSSRSVSIVVDGVGLDVSFIDDVLKKVCGGVEVDGGKPTLEEATEFEDQLV